MAEDEAKERSAERAVESIAMLPVLTDSSGIFVSRLAAKSTEAHISHAPIDEAAMLMLAPELVGTGNP
jgi:hypothetical protein